MTSPVITFPLDQSALFGLEVDQQNEIFTSQQEAVTPLIVESPYLMDHLGSTVSAIKYDPKRKLEASEALDEGHYRLQIQAVIHHQGRIGAFKHKEKFQGFIYSVPYSPEPLISHLMDRIRKTVKLSTGILSMLRKVEHPDMGDVLLHGDEADMLLNAHLHVDEIKQEITLTMPFIMGYDPGETISLGSCTLDFLEDIEWTAIPEALHPALRSYLFSVDAIAVAEDAALCQAN